MGPRAWVVVAAVAVLSVWASPAWGAFPGRDGDLVVATGTGLELVAPASGAASAICSSVVLCGHPAQPSFSANGRALAFVDTTSGRPVVLAADGSCLWCLLGAPFTSATGSEAAFTPGGRGVTIARNGLWSVSLTGGGARRLVKGRVDDAVWSSRGLVALVRRGWIWIGRPGHGKLRRLARGRSPSFSPDSARLALTRDNFVWVVRVADGSERRLIRGGAPAWSPNGRQIAYIGSGGRVEIVAIRGGRPHHVGSVRGTALDWQPLPISEHHPCEAAPGSTTLASNREAAVYSHGNPGAPGSPIFYGCLKALGRTRLLLNTSTIGYFYGVIAVRLAGRFAALDVEYDSPQDITDDETLYDLSSGKATDLGAVSWDWNGGPTDYALDSLALDSSGFAAWRATSSPLPEAIAAISCPSPSLCVAGDSAGNILTSAQPTAAPTAWNIAAVSDQAISAVSCPSISPCVAVGTDGDVLTSADPAGGASAWNRAAVHGAYLNAVSCPSVSLCVAGGGSIFGGRPTILTSTDPTGGASSWTSAQVASSDESITAVSCPSVSLCVATTNNGHVLTSTNPAGGANAWDKTTVDRGAFLGAVSCPSVSLCVAGDTNDNNGDNNGNLLTTTNPTGGASAWTKATIDPAGPGNPVTLVAVSCPSVSLCVAGDSFGNILTSTDPTGGASAWARASVEQRSALGNSVNSVSCPSVALCVAGGTGDILTSTDPTGSATLWSRAIVDVAGCAPLLAPCLSAQLYVRDDQGTRVVDTAPPGTGNAIGNVALDGDSVILSWTHDGAKRQLALR